jgi:peroxiredoxin|tara:strand:+ start:275 stop:742 length:468 start_codon:yes stop_codon:yes gene_type:complete
MSQLNDRAPLFELKNTNKEAVSLSDHIGKPVVLAFFPGAYTGVCDTEMCTLRDSMAVFNDLSTTVFGISVDSPWANGAFSKEYDLNFALLSDYNREVVRKYDVTFNGLGGLEGYESSNRAVVIIDSDGIIKYRWVAENPGVEPNYDEIISTLKNM